MNRSIDQSANTYRSITHHPNSQRIQPPNRSNPSSIQPCHQRLRQSQSAHVFRRRLVVPRQYRFQNPFRDGLMAAPPGLFATPNIEMRNYFRARMRVTASPAHPPVPKITAATPDHRPADLVHARVTLVVEESKVEARCPGEVLAHCQVARQRALETVSM